MQLPGRLGPVTLGDVLGVLYRGRATGVLALTEALGAGRAHRILLDGGLVVGVDTPLPAPSLGEVLVREGFLDGAAARRILVGPGERIGEVLVRAGCCQKSLVDAALRQQLRERVEALFAVSGARVSFHVSGPRPPPAGRLTPREFLHGRPRGGRRASRATTAEGTPDGERSRLRRDPVRARALDTLGLPEHAGDEDVRRAFRMLARRHHPDAHPAAGPEEREARLARFAALSAAYHTLVA